MALETIYVKLLDEGVLVWRPVMADRVSGDVYQIANQPYDSQAEHWEFAPGDRVQCEIVVSSDGPIRAAVRLAD